MNLEEATIKALNEEKVDIQDLQMEIYEMIQVGRKMDNQDMELNIDQTIAAIREEYPTVDMKELGSYVRRKANEIYAGEYDELTESLSEDNKIISGSEEFYIGDPCYVLGDNIYSDIWGDKFGYCNGKIDCGNGQAFLVHGTAYGDGSYDDDDFNSYGVDSGTLAVIPVELCEKLDNLSWGRVVSGKEATLEYDNGKFFITVDKKEIVIDTDPDYDYEEEDYDWEDDGIDY